MKKYTLAIETSCDDTSISILDEYKVLSCVTKNSCLFLNEYGGIVPEIASRKHEEYIIDVYNDAMKKANISSDQLKYICYTNNPGLPGSLHIGEIFAKSLGFLLSIEPIGIDHIHSHIFSSFINIKNIEYPFLSLITSGKTTSIFLVNSPDDIVELNKTKDDAIGEVFDKIGKALGLPYPGGPEIDKIYDESKVLIKHMFQPVEQSFSFSGIKSFFLNIINNNHKYKYDKETIASSFMNWAIKSVLKKLIFYSKKYNIKNISIGGGVSANSLFKKEIESSFENRFVPLKEYSCDNAAMIGYFFYQKYINKK